MFERILDWWDELDPQKKKLFIGILLGVAFVILIAISAFWIATDLTKDKMNETEISNTQEIDSTENKDTSDNLETEIESETESKTEINSNSDMVEEDPQSTVNGNMTNQEGASVNISQVVNKIPSNETQELTIGIDVARYQGTIDWKKVADSGVDFAIIRVGYRTLKTGEIIADSNAKYNMQEATKHGIKIGAYFFSTAITKEEAIEEANWVANYIAKYKITYPVVYNCEGYEDTENRQYSLTKTQRTDIAITFLNRISEKGYSPMFYASKGELEGDVKWETSRLARRYKIWVAQYPNTPYPQTAKSSYSGKYDMWQYTNNGTVPGISKPVDMNVAYFGFSNTSEAQDNQAPEDATADVEATMKFREVNETITAKDRTNLRNKPSQGSDSKVIYTLTNGETATRTGISDSGWSRIIFKGQTLYAVSSYLTTDLTVNEPDVQEEPDDGVQTKFTPVDDWVTPKDAVNLRTLPSVTNESSQVIVKINKGEKIHRIGINNELGWSKVEYNGQILYCVTSYLNVVDAPME